MSEYANEKTGDKINKLEHYSTVRINERTYTYYRKEVIEKQTTTLNLGPTHPATHGVFQNILELDGETSDESNVYRRLYSPRF